MTLEEIFSNIAKHMVKGMMIHDQMANYYDFLGLKGYKRCHEYHYLCECCEFRGLNRYFINHENKLIPLAGVENPNIIPETWYKYSRQDVDTNTKKNAVKNGYALWESWEKETKQLYEDMYKELMNIDEIAAALKIKELICDVDKELKDVERCVLELKAVDYNMSHIISMQEHYHEKYRKCTKKLGVEIC